jgi:HEAT repeat protein
MKRKVLILVAVVAFVVGAILLVLDTHDEYKGIPDRVVQGKLISMWAKEALAIDNDFNALQVLRTIGPEATPFLIHGLRKKDSRLNTLYVALWPKLPNRIKQRLTQPSLARDVRMRAVAILRDMGGPGIKAAVPDLVARLADSDSHVRLHSAITLGNIGPEAMSARPALEPFLKDKSHTVRVYTAIAAWKITGNAEPSLTILENGLQDRKAPFCWAAAVFLGEMGPAARRAIPLLADATKDAHKGVASLALQSLAQIGPETLPILTNALADPDAAIRISAATALGKLGPKAKEAGPMLMNALDDHARGAPMIMGRTMGTEQVSASARNALQLIDPELRKK